MKLSDFFKLYFAISIAHLVFLDVNDSPMLIYITKPLILFSILAYYIAYTPQKGAFEKRFIAGFILSLLGDVFLMFDQELMFIVGLTAFLSAHFCFLTAFFYDVKIHRGSLVKSPLLILPVTAYAGFLLFLLWPNLGVLNIPVFIYTAVISIMFLSALNRRKKTSRQSYLWGLVGATFFLLSDSILALNKFVPEMIEIPKPHLLIMGTYCIAQYGLLVSAMAKQEPQESV